MPDQAAATEQLTAAGMGKIPAHRKYVMGDGKMTARILCLIILLLEIRGLSLSLTNRKWKVLIYFFSNEGRHAANPASCSSVR